ncbi:Protein fmp52, mitochondrial [Collariella sp. IMI 366227]|nr:Protein fmp52, mitochondrial [Collariella sp. IMI 366227]
MTSTALVGCTGLVGSHILTTLLADNSISAVHTISRRAPKSTGAKLHPVIEADTTTWVSWLKGIAPPPTTVYSGLGTTRAAAGGIANQWKIDHDLNVELAKAAKEAGVRNFVFISSTGTGSPLATMMPYSKMKRGVEDTVKELGFETAVIVRPGMIIGEREVPHQGAPLLLGMITGLKSVFGEGKAPAKFWVLEQRDIIKLGRTEWKE